ncbi:MAG: replicative DNA helicase [Spirochaetales bacterium]|nr:replicative DNA helicase [Spirochaetales bacterium]
MSDQVLKDKMPPYNEEAEMALIGSCLKDPEIVNDIIKIVKPSDFYKNSHILIFQAIQHVIESGQNPDIISLVNYLRSESQLEQAGGSSYIASLTDAVPTIANATYYSQLVRDASVRRDIIRISSQMVSECYDKTVETEELIESAEKKFFTIAEAKNFSEIKTVKDIIPRTMDKIESLINSKESMTGVPSGIARLDYLTNGFQKSDFIIVGARPSIGKTALATSIAANIAIRKNIPVGFFTLEMPAEALIERILAGEAKVDFQKVRNGLLPPADLKKLVDAASRIYEAPFYVDDTPNISLFELKAQARRMKRKYDIKILFVDYIGIMRSDDRANIPRHEKVAEFSRQLKALARELEVPVVCLSQVGRQTEGKAPTLADIRETGSIEQDADIVMFLHRDRSGAEVENTEVIETDLDVAKHRNGPTGTIKLGFVKKYTRYESLATDNE